MSSRNRKPGRTSPHFGDWVAARAMELEPVDVKKYIEREDYARYESSLMRVRSHPKNLLRLSMRRYAEAKESARNSGNIAAFKAAARRSMQNR